MKSRDNTTYEADIEPRGASMYYLSQNWAFSSTGNFMDNDIDADAYIVTNTSTISKVSAQNAHLYTTARVSPLSLTYYGLCLMNGIYTVKLHFAEIVFKNDSSFIGLGKRIFDVYIQVDKFMQCIYQLWSQNKKLESFCFKICCITRSVIFVTCIGAGTSGAKRF